MTNTLTPEQERQQQTAAVMRAWCKGREERAHVAVTILPDWKPAQELLALAASAKEVERTT